MMNAALLLIDIQNDYFSQGRMPLPRSLEVSERAGSLLNVCRQVKHMHVLHVQHISTDPKATCFFPCTHGAELHDHVKPLSNELIIKKHYPNAFKDTVLLAHLHKLKVRHLVIGGMMTQMCIDSTVRAAYDFGFSVTLLHDVCAARSLEFNGEFMNADTVHSVFMAALNHKYASVMSSEQFISRLHFRSIEAA